LETPNRRTDTGLQPVGGDIVLIKPTASLATEFRALAEESLAAGDPRYQEAMRDVPQFIRLTEEHANGWNLPEGWVPQSTFWLVRGGERILGCSRVRHRLSAFLSEQGGHIGYDARPSERGRGYGTLLLRLTLPEARNLGLARVLIIADEANVASWRMIERNGGVREEGSFMSNGGPMRRYWVVT
jgi:predicted acetyltransferase